MKKNDERNSGPSNEKGGNALVTRDDGLPSLLDLRVIGQARTSVIPVDLLPDFLEVAEEHRRVFHIAVHRARRIRGVVARHSPLAVEILAFEYGLDLAPHDVNAAVIIVAAAAAAVIIVVGGGPLVEARGRGADLGADVLVEDCVSGGGDLGREGGVGELGGELGCDLGRGYYFIGLACLA